MEIRSGTGSDYFDRGARWLFVAGRTTTGASGRTKIGGHEVNFFVLYLLLLKAVLTSFSGMASLPMVRHDLVVQRHAMTDRQLNAAVVAGRTGPGPNGLYLVAVGYYAGGYFRHGKSFSLRRFCSRSA